MPIISVRDHKNNRFKKIIIKKKKNNNDRKDQKEDRSYSETVRAK